MKQPITHDTYPAMNKPLLLCGCPRGLFWIAVLIGCVVLLVTANMPGGTFWAIGVAVAGWLTGVALHRYDPKAVELSWITLNLGKYYAAGKRGYR